MRRINSFMVRTADVLNIGLWRLFPTINVDKVKDIPCDYPGAMGVPITFFDKFDRKQFEILDMARPKIGNRELYVRIIIRNLRPELPEFIDLAEWLERTGAGYEIVEQEAMP